MSTHGLCKARNSPQLAINTIIGAKIIMKVRTTRSESGLFENYPDMHLPLHGKVFLPGQCSNTFLFSIKLIT